MSTAGRQRTRLAASLDAFSVTAFCWVWSAALSGNSGRFAVIFVAGWEAYRLGGHSALWPGLVSFLLLVPTMLFGLISGSFADRINRAAIAATGQAVNSAACAACAGLVAAHALNLPLLMCMVAVVGLGNSIQAPAWQALVPALVGQDRLLNAAAATRIAQQGSELLGPAVATAVLATAGPAPTFGLCAAFYLGGVLMLTRVFPHAPRPATRAAHHSLVRAVREGFSYIGERSVLRLLFLWVTLHCGLTMASFGVLPTLASSNFHGQAEVYGLLLTAFGAGSIVGPLWIMGFGHSRSFAFMLFVSGILSGAPLAGLGLTRTVSVAFLMSGLAGLGQSVFMALIYSSVMSNTSETLRGRIASVQLSITTGVMGLASLGWGALVSVASAGLIVFVPGIVFTAACVALVPRLFSLDARLAAGRDDAGLPVVQPATAE